jgi:hypothetical protein
MSIMLADILEETRKMVEAKKARLQGAESPRDGTRRLDLDAIAKTLLELEDEGEPAFEVISFKADLYKSMGVDYEEEQRALIAEEQVHGADWIQRVPGLPPSEGATGKPPAFDREAFLSRIMGAVEPTIDVEVDEDML